MLVRMHDAEIERILRALRTPLSVPPPGVVKRVRRGVDPGRSSAAGNGRGELAAAERRPKTRVKDVGWMSEAEARRLRKVIRTSFGNSPHKKKYWTALLDMCAGPDAGKRVRRGRAASSPSAVDRERGRV
jgi:hypothetical protein